MTFFEIQSLIQNAKTLDFGNILDNSIDLFKKIWLKGFLLILILAVIAFGVTLLFGLFGFTADPIFYDRDVDFSLLKAFSEVSLYSIPQTIIMSCVSIALLAAYYRMCKDVDLGGKQNDDYFYFFKGEYLGKILFLGVIYTLIATVAQMMFLIPYIYVFIPLSYFSVILANNPDLSEAEIVKASFNLGTKKWFISFGLLFVTGILGILGFIACGIGILFTISIMYLPLYFIYKDVIGFEDNSEIFKIGTE